MAMLGDLAKLVRSKNAGPFWLTIDIMFDDAEAYRRARDAEIVNRAAIARLYNRNPADIIVVNHDTALAIKVSFPRPQSSGAKHDSDVYGGQQYAPLLGLEVPGLKLYDRSGPKRPHVSAPVPVAEPSRHARRAL